MERRTLLLLIIFNATACFNRPTPTPDFYFSLIKSKASRIPQGYYIKLPFDEDKRAKQLHFISSPDAFFCAFFRANDDGKKSVYISRSENLLVWTEPFAVVQNLTPDFNITDFFMNIEKEFLYICLSKSEMQNKFVQAYQGVFGFDWQLMTSTDLQKILKERHSVRYALNFNTSRPPDYDVEIDSLKRILIADFTTRQKYFTGLSEIGNQHFLLVDSEGNIYLSYDNRQTLALPYFGKGSGLIRMDLQKLESDSDGDGLKDIDEIYYGLDYLGSDSDSDGMHDYRDRNPLSTNSPFSQADSIRQAALECITPWEIWQDSTAVLSVNLGSSDSQAFIGNKCRILSNVNLPSTNIHFNEPFLLAHNQAQIEVSFRSPLENSHGFTVSLVRKNRKWTASGLDRTWVE